MDIYFFFATEARTLLIHIKERSKESFTCMEGDITYNLKKTGTQDELKLT